MNPKPVGKMPALKEAAAPVVQQAATPMEMLQQALQSGASLEMMEKLIELQERWQGSQARRAFDQAISEAKAEIKPIRRNKRVQFKSKDSNKPSTDYAHETLDEIARTIDPILAKHGLSYRHRTAQKDASVQVTCVISHRDGHFEETSLSSGYDQSGNKNHIQAIGSAVTYLQRYTLKVALGLAAADDDDGKASDMPGKITEAQLNELIALADKGQANKRVFCDIFKVEGLADIPAAKFEEAKRLMQAKIRKLEKEAAPSDDS